MWYIRFPKMNILPLMNFSSSILRINNFHPEEILSNQERIEEGDSHPLSCYKICEIATADMKYSDT